MSAMLMRGFSKEAQYIDRQSLNSVRNLHDFSALGSENTVRDELATVWEECREPNWDGFAALPVTQDTLRNAYLFLEALPFGFPQPSVGAEPDGDLTLEWHRSSRRTLSVSINAYGDLNYAALLGPNRTYGTETFFGDVPDAILSLIRRVHAE